MQGHCTFHFQFELCFGLFTFCSCQRQSGSQAPQDPVEALPVP